MTWRIVPSGCRLVAVADGVHNRAGLRPEIVKEDAS
jgi:hypothetical protein